MVFCDLQVCWSQGPWSRHVQSDSALAAARADPGASAPRRSSGGRHKKGPPDQPGLAAWGSGRHLCGSTGGPVITGAGLDPSCAPAGIPSSGSDGEGCWGGETARADADVGGVVVRVVAVPHRRAGVVGSVVPRPAGQQLGDPPSFRTLSTAQRTCLGPHQKSRRLRRQLQLTNSQQPGQSQQPRAKGKRAQGPRREPGGEGQHGRRPLSEVSLSGLLLFRKAARQR